VVQIFKLWNTRKYVANFGQICSTYVDYIVVIILSIAIGLVRIKAI